MNKKMAGRPVFVIDGSRTPFLKAGNEPGPFRASDLALRAAQPLLNRQPFAPDQLDEVILGCVNPGPDEANIGRVVALRAGCGRAVTAWTVQRNCGSGMQAVDSAARNIASGRSELVLAGGTEAMSHAPLLFTPAMVAWLGRFSGAKTTGQKLRAAAAFKPAYLKPVIGLLRGLTDHTVGLSMGKTAEILAYKFGLQREQLDEYAVRSHQRLANAHNQGYLEEIEPLYDDKGQVHDFDQGVRPDSSAEKLAKLRPVFDPQFGMVTAGNSSQITDGAAWLLLASEAAVKKYQLPIIARIVDCHWAGNDPSEMGLGPVYSCTPLMQRNKLNMGDIEYWELNEAFAAQVLACREAWRDDAFCRAELGLKKAFGEIDMDRLNVDGGAIALGHPVGASGARIILHLIHVLRRHQAHTGIATQCIGGGQGGGTLVEV